jgi:hypothetical protein
MNDIKVSQYTNGEGKSQEKKREQGNVDTPKSRTYSLAKKALGVATAALLLGGATAADLLRTGTSGSTLDLKGSNNLTDHIPPPLPSPEYLKKLGILDHERFYREVSQRTSSEETLPDFRSKMMIPSEETSRSAMETPSGQLEQKEIEPLQLSKEDVGSLQSFANSLEQNQAALRGFRKLLNDKGAMEGMRNLMQDEEFRRRALSELRDEKSVKQAISLLENEVSNGTCTKWYKKYTNPGSVYYHECCKDEGNNFCEENVKRDKGRLARYILGSIYGYTAVFWVYVCCCATRCCRADNSAHIVEEITEFALRWPELLCGDGRHSPPQTDQTPPAAEVEMSQRQNDQGERQQQDAPCDDGLLSRTDGSSSKVPVGESRSLERPQENASGESSSSHSAHESLEQGEDSLDRLVDRMRRAIEQNMKIREEGRQRLQQELNSTQRQLRQAAQELDQARQELRTRENTLQELMNDLLANIQIQTPDRSNDERIRQQIRAEEQRRAQDQAWTRWLERQRENLQEREQSLQEALQRKQSPCEVQVREGQQQRLQRLQENLRENQGSQQIQLPREILQGVLQDERRLQQELQAGERRLQGERIAVREELEGLPYELLREQLRQRVDDVLRRQPAREQL